MTKRRKRPLEGSLVVEGYALGWTLKSEQIWDPKGAHVGLRLSIQRTDETRRELILEYPFRAQPAGKTHLRDRPEVDPHALAADIRLAMQAGWNPKSRGRPFVFVLD